MKVKDLIKILQTVDPDTKVLISSDAEGNSFSELADCETSYACRNDYESRHGMVYEVGIKTLTPELEEDGYTEEDVVDGESCVILWP